MHDTLILDRKTTVSRFSLLRLTDEAVHKLYGDKIAVNMTNNGVTVHTVVLPGEEVRRCTVSQCHILGVVLRALHCISIKSNVTRNT